MNAIWRSPRFSRVRRIVLICSGIAPAARDIAGNSDAATEYPNRLIGTM